MSAAAPLGADTLQRWQEKPQVMVRELFGATPDAWQDNVLEAFPHKPRIAMKACKGPGKTTVMAWCAWNFLLTRIFANIVAVSINGDNLRDGLWKEMAVWQGKSPLLQAMFQWAAKRITRKGDNAAKWFMAARTWKDGGSQEEIGNTLAGMHSDNVMFLIDEAGSIPPAILMSAEGALANMHPGQEAHVVIAGNTTSVSGALYDACVNHAALWHTVIITGDPDDPLRSPRVSLEWAREMIREHGRDNPFVKIMVLGQWPPGSVDALIGVEDVKAAMNRQYPEYQLRGFADVLGLDVARFGDDASVLTHRKGLQIFPQLKWRNLDGPTLAGKVKTEWDRIDADACFIDMTGGYGASCFDHIKILGKTPIGVQYAGEANEKHRYFNKRTEMYWLFAQWLRDGGALPSGAVELLQQLPQINYTIQRGLMLLEPKDSIKAKLQGVSPDESDSAAQTFAQAVTAKGMMRGPTHGRDAAGMYDTFAEAFRSTV